MDTLKLNTVYSSFMGECNIHGIGVPCTFIRLAGCNLRCYSKTKSTLCDTPEALSVEQGRSVTAYEIIQRVIESGNKVVCLTGGEPLLQNVTKLLTSLSNLGLFVVVETNGSKSIEPYRHIRNVSFVVDVKSPSSGEDEKMLEENYNLLDENDFVKFVIDNEKDFNTFKSWVIAHNYLRCKIAVGLFWGSNLSYQRLMSDLLSMDRVVYLNMQTHKLACLYDYHRSDDTFGNLFIPRDL